MSHKYVTLVLAPIALFLGACQSEGKVETEDTGGASIAGTYTCKEERAPEEAPEEEWLVREGDPLGTGHGEDGTITFTSPTQTLPNGEKVTAIVGKGYENLEGSTFEGTWSAEGDTAKVTFRGETETFKIEGDRLVAGGGRFVCTKT